MQVAGLPDSQTQMFNPDFAAVARAMGMKLTLFLTPMNWKIP